MMNVLHFIGKVNSYFELRKGQLRNQKLEIENTTAKRKSTKRERR